MPKEFTLTGEGCHEADSEVPVLLSVGVSPGSDRVMVVTGVNCDYWVEVTGNNFCKKLGTRCVFLGETDVNVNKEGKFVRY